MDINNQNTNLIKMWVGVAILLVVIAGGYFIVKPKKDLAVELSQTQNGGTPMVAGETKIQEVGIEKVDEHNKIVFGYSVAGKPIEGYVIGSGENVVFLHASLHGDEIGTTDLLNKLVEEIQTGNIAVATPTKLIIIPIANPDGYYDRTDKLNANKVNLNLNFATSDWQEYGPQGTFAGKVPFSEIEARVLKEVVEQYKPALMVAYHSEGALVSPESGKASIAFAKWYAKKTGYDYYEYWDYPGTATKWFEETTGKPAITVELTKQVTGDWSLNKAALIELVSTDINLLPIK